MTMNAYPNQRHLTIRVKQFTNEMQRKRIKCPQDDICSSLTMNASSKDIERSDNHDRKVVRIYSLKKPKINRVQS